MVKRRIAALAAVLVGISFLTFAGFLVTALFAGGSAGGTLSTGRSVMAYSDSLALSTMFSTDTATIETGGRSIVVRPTSLIVDGETIADIEENASDILVDVRRGAVTFVADGVPVRTKLK